MWKVNINPLTLGENTMLFSDAVDNQEVRTLNDMKARKSTANACVDLFFKIGASRGQNIVPQFIAAFVENSDYALRILQWARDVRGGAGERQLFKDILKELANNYPVTALKIIDKIPEIGRWDDMLLDYNRVEIKNYVYSELFNAIMSGNGLAAKWAPRKGKIAVEIRKAWGFTPKQYRKFIVNASKTVEQQMCAKKWDEIDFNKVPSLAASRYRNAFYKNCGTRFEEYVEALKSGDESIKINAGAIYPYDVLKGLFRGFGASEAVKTDHRVAQWEALENFIGDASILPMVDTSGSMSVTVGNNDSLNCMEVAISLGLYCAEKNKGKFKDLLLTFSENPDLVRVKGNVVEKAQQLSRAEWGMNTNLHRAFDKVLNTAVKNNVPANEMPEVLVILSDMQFDRCVKFDDSAIEMIRRKYEQEGYEVPQIVFWNLNAYDNVPVSFNERGVALVSGFSPSIMKAVLACDFEEFTPEAIMLQTIMVDRYNY